MHSTTMKNVVRRGMFVIGIAGGITILGSGIAASSASADEAPPGALVVSGTSAGDDDETTGEDGTASGNQVEADADAPVDVSNNQVTVIGDGNQSTGGDGSEPSNGVEPDADVDHTSGEDGTLSGNQVEAEVDAPVEASGNQVTVIGDRNESAGSSSEGSCEPSATGADGDKTSGEDGLLSGNQVDADVDAPVDVTGNQVTVIGDENQSAGSTSGGDCTSPTPGPGDRTSGEDGAVAGNQVDADAFVPVDASGNQVTVVGDGNQSGGSTESGPAEGSTSGSGDGDGDTTSGEDGQGSGNQLEVAPFVPMDASGNQVTVIGDGNQSGGSTESGPAEGSTSGSGDGDGDTTSGEDGQGSGNQLEVAPFVPVDASGNQVTVVGDGNQSGGSTESGPAEGSTSGSGDGDTTSGEDGQGSGNQLEVAPFVPVDASGNQVTVVGDGNQSGGSTESGPAEGSTSGSGDGDGDTTSGEDGQGSGNQLEVAPFVPVDASGNQVTVIGDGNESDGSEDGDAGGDNGGDTGDDGDPAQGGDQDGDGDGEVLGGSGGPGRPGTVAGLDAVTGPVTGPAAGPAAGVLPSTGASDGLRLLGTGGLLLLLMGLALTALRRKEVVTS